MPSAFYPSYRQKKDNCSCCQIEPKVDAETVTFDPVSQPNKKNPSRRIPHGLVAHSLASLRAQVRPLEADRPTDERSRKNYRSRRLGGFQNSGKGLLNRRCGALGSGVAAGGRGGPCFALGSLLCDPV